MKRSSSYVLATLLLAGFFVVLGPAAAAQELPLELLGEESFDAPLPASALTDTAVAQIEVPDISVNFGGAEDGGLSQTVVIILLLTVAAVAPGVLLLTTSFTRFAVVLGLTRNAIGAQSIPPAQVLIGLALFLTVFIMGPIFGKVYDDAVKPMLAGEMSQDEAFEAGFAPLRDFMLAQTEPDDLRMFMSMQGDERPAVVEDVSASALVPAFVVSELRAAFVIGFVIFVPFLIIDLIVSAVLMSMGMVMLPPAFISLPLKLLLFVLVDGWALVIGSVVSSVNGVA